MNSTTVKSIGVIAFMTDGKCRQINLSEEQSELVKAMLPGLFLDGIVSISEDTLPLTLKRRVMAERSAKESSA